MTPFVDPLQFVKALWPDIRLYDKQAEILYSICQNKHTVSPAGNKLGKDFVASLACLYFFLTRHPVRVVTSSVDEDQLKKVLWGEIRHKISHAAYKLPLIVGDMNIKKIVNGQVCDLSYLTGRVASKENKGAGLLGHHLPFGPKGAPATLACADEASAFSNDFMDKMQTWAHVTLAIGNPFDCENFFKHALKGDPTTDDRGGDIPSPVGAGCYRKVIQIRAEDSPHVRRALVEVWKGLRRPPESLVRAASTPWGHYTREEYERLLEAWDGVERPEPQLIPGVLSFSEYVERRSQWDRIRQCISLDATFYEGSENLLYPPEWLDRAERIAEGLQSKRQAKAIGIDPGEGAADTSMYAVDEYGIVEGISKPTPDTNVVTGNAIEFGKRLNVPPDNWIFDQGGGGKWCADRLRDQGYPVRTVAFGETATDMQTMYQRMRAKSDKISEREERYAYKNRRAEMYALLRMRLDPTNETGFGIPRAYHELRRQLAPIPLKYDNEGRLYLPPKNKPKDNSNVVTLTELIGRSPDDADALVMAIWCMENPKSPRIAGAL